MQRDHHGDSAQGNEMFTETRQLRTSTEAASGGGCLPQLRGVTRLSLLNRQLLVSKLMHYNNTKITLQLKKDQNIIFI